MSVPPSPCPNCGVLWMPSVAVCPHCGYVRPAWPPPPVGFVAPMRAVTVVTGQLVTGQLVTGNARGDVLLGFFISAASCLAALSLMSGHGSLFRGNLDWGLGLLVPPILYLVLRPRYPSLARGMGWGVLTGCVLLPFVVVAVLVALALGILALCDTSGHH